MREFLKLTPEQGKKIIAEYISNKLGIAVKPESVEFELENIGEWAEDGEYLSEITVEVKTEVIVAG